MRLECAGDAVQLDATFAQRVEVEVSALMVVTDALSDSRIDVAHARNVSVSVEAGALATHSTLNANFSALVTFSCDTLKEICAAGSAGCVAWTVNATRAETINLSFDGKLAAPGGEVHAEHAKQVNVRLRSDEAYDKDDANNRRRIAPCCAAS